MRGACSNFSLDFFTPIFFFVFGALTAVLTSFFFGVGDFLVLTGSDLVDVTGSSSNSSISFSKRSISESDLSNTCTVVSTTGFLPAPDNILDDLLILEESKNLDFFILTRTGGESFGLGIVVVGDGETSSISGECLGESTGGDG